MPLRDIYPPARTDRGRLRVGLALAGLCQPRWIASAIVAIGECGAASVTTIIRLPASQPADRGGCLAYRLYRCAEAAYFSRYARDGGAMAKIDIAPLVEGTPVIEAAITASGQITPDDVARVRRERLDVILLFQTSMPHDNLTETARYGVWRYHHGDGTRYGAGPPMFWELYDGWPTTGVRLQLFGPGGRGPHTICRASASTHCLSLFMNRQKPCMTATAFAARGLRALQRHGPAAMEEWVEDKAPEASALPAERGQPGNFDVARLVVKILLRWMRLRWASRRGEWWFLAARHRPPVSLGEDTGDQTLKGFRPLPVPPGRFHADPFLFEQDGDTHLFLEDFDVARQRGVISHCRLDAEGKATAPHVVLDRPYHLSYPFVFRWNGEIFMLPETSQNKTIELYRAETFPHRWALHRVLLEGWRATDATLHCDDAGRWWLFTTIDECGGGNCHELFLFQAESPLGPWQAHPRNPIVTDVRWARPGGRLFRRNARLIRPAQDCAARYGGGLWLMEVLELNEASYRERPLQRLGPEWLSGNRCLHHLDTTNRFEIIDGMRFRPVTGAKKCKSAYPIGDDRPHRVAMAQRIC